MHVAVVGLNHKTAPIEVRERVAFTAEEIPHVLQNLKGLMGGGVLLSTCNRTEIYVFTEGVEDVEGMEGAVKTVRELLGSRLRQCVTNPFYCYEDSACVRHLFRVASGLDSMMIGEHQILGQVREAYQSAQQAGVVGAVLDELFRRAISTGKRARTETNISKGAVSVGSAAVELARSIHGDLRNCTVMLIGAGKMGEVTARYLKNIGVKELYISNRTRQRAEELASVLGGEVVAYEELWTWLAHADIVITSTGSPHFIIVAESLRGVMRQRRQRPIFLIDIAVPRNVDPQANKLDGVFLYDIDDLESVMEDSIKGRQQQMARVEAIIEEELAKFMSWLAAQQAKPTILALLNKAEQVRKDCLGEVLSRLPNLSERERQAIESMAKTLTMRLLKDPLAALNELPASENGADILRVVREVFKLDKR